jgi:xanthine/uracil permease
MTNPIVLERATIPGRGKDIPILIAIVGIVFCLVASYPVNVLPFRESIFRNIMGRESYSQVENFTLTGITIAFCTTISIIFPKISSVLSILGGLLAVQTAYFLPLVIHVRLSEKRWY